MTGRVRTASGRARVLLGEEPGREEGGRAYRPQERLIVLMLIEGVAGTGTV